MDGAEALMITRREFNYERAGVRQEWSGGMIAPTLHLPADVS
jgi:hypothetical protein